MLTAPSVVVFLLLISAASPTAPAPISSSSFSFPSFHSVPSLSLLGDARLSPPSGAITMSSGAILHLHSLPFGRMPCFSSRASFSLPPRAARLALLLSPEPSLPASAVLALDLAPLPPPFPARKLCSWLDFDARTRLLELRLADAGAARPPDPVLAYPLDLTGAIWREEMFVGLRSYTAGNSTQAVTVYDWSFEVRSAAPYRMHSEPLDPSALVKAKPPRHVLPATVVEGRAVDRAMDVLVVLAAGAACGAAVAFLAVLTWFGKVERHQVAPAEYKKISAIADRGLERGVATEEV